MPDESRPPSIRQTSGKENQEHFFGFRRPAVAFRFMRLPRLYKFVWLLFFYASMNSFPVLAQVSEKADTNFLRQLMGRKPDLFRDVLAGKEGLEVQLIYTRIDADKKGKVKMTDFYFGVDDERYFYPASTVKLPIAILALQKLRELKITGLDYNSTMITGTASPVQTAVYNDPSTAEGPPTIAHYIKKILLVSDNDAYNRLYEFLGQDYINQQLHAMGYTGVEILHRLEISLPESENRLTNPVRFYDRRGQLLYEKPAETSTRIYAKRSIRKGKDYMRGGQLIQEPFDFSLKNRLPLTTLHAIVKSVLFPESVPSSRRFKLEPEDYLLLRKYMSMIPAESSWPRYDSSQVWDTYVKFLYYGSEKNSFNPDIRLFNKPGDAYGFMIDAGCLVQFSTRSACLVSAVIHCNSDGIYNDDHYDYSTVGLPFLKAIGHLMLEYEQTRVRKKTLELDTFLFPYKE